MRIAAAKGLGTVGHPGSAEPLVRLARDREHFVRAAALDAAQPLVGDDALAAAALDAVGDEAWQV